MNIAITGATGFIGGHLVKYLLKLNKYKIIILLQEGEKFDISSEPNIEIINTNFSYTDLLNVFKSVDQIIHLAGVRMPKSNKYVSINYFYDANIKLLENILKAASKCETRRVIMSSSIAVYGDIIKSEYISENSMLNPINNYGLSKLIGEQLMYQFSRNTSIETVALRFSQIFGIGEKENLIMRNFINKCLKGEDIMIYPSGFQKRDYLYILDALNAIETVMDQDSMNGFYNIGSNIAYSAYEIADIIKEELNSPSKIIISKSNHLFNKIVMDNSKFQKETRWKPKWTLRESIRDMISHIN